MLSDPRAVPITLLTFILPTNLAPKEFPQGNISRIRKIKENKAKEQMHSQITNALYSA